MKLSTLIICTGLAGAFGAVLTLASVEFLDIFTKADVKKTQYIQPISDTPGMDFLDDLKCPLSHKKIVLINGVEDGFSRKGLEPSVVREGVKDKPSIRSMIDPDEPYAQIRNFDERGANKRLIGSFMIPPGITQAYFLARTRPAGDDRTDKIMIGNYDYRFVEHEKASKGYHQRLSFLGKSLPLLKARPLSENPELTVVNLSEFSHQNGELYLGFPDILSFVTSFQEPTALDYIISDDTIVDFVGMSLCQKPLQERGITLRKVYQVDGLSKLNCSDDFDFPLCNPYSGDLVCEAQVPLACFKDFDNKPPHDLPKYGDVDFNSGMVKVTKPIAGNHFKTREQANQFCRAQFGDAWRVLSFHDARTGNIVINTPAEMSERVWIDIRDQPYGNCWSRPDE